MVLTCRSGHYQNLEDLRIWAHDAARVELSPVDAAGARDFLAARAADPARWDPVLTAIAAAPEGPLAQGLSTPWRLTVAAVVYDQRDPSGAFVRNPADLVDLADWTGPEEVRDHLLGLLLPAALALHPAPDGADVARVHRWLATLAGYLNHNAVTGRVLGGRVLSGTDLVLHELWPLGGFRLPRALAAAFHGIAALPLLLLLLPWQIPSTAAELPAWGLRLVIPTALIVFVVWHGWAEYWPKPGRADLRRLRTPAGRRQVVDGLVFGLRFGLVFGFVVVLVDGFENGFETGIEGGIVVVLVSNLVGVLAAGLMLSLGFGLAIGPAVDLVEDLAIGLVIGLRSAGLRYAVLLACTRRWNKVWLPWRLGRFLHWTYQAGLFRVAGIAYQFRHRELQDYLARHPTTQP